MRPLREKFMKSIYDYKVDDSQKNPVSLSDYKGKTLLIVNVASRCGLTPQYKGLQELYSKYSNKDFEILPSRVINLVRKNQDLMKKLRSFVILIST